MEISTSIKEIAKYRGQTLAELACNIGVTKQNLHSILTGSPNISSLEKIAKALNVEPWQILHPEPLAVIDKEPEPVTITPQDNETAKILCPICKSHIEIKATAAGLLRAEVRRY